MTSTRSLASRDHVRRCLAPSRDGKMAGALRPRSRQEFRMLTADEKMNRVVFYQELPVARVKRAFFLNFAAIAYSCVMLLVGRFVPLALWGGMAMLVLLVPLLAGNVIVLLGLQRLPMLILDAESLVYRRVHILWKDIAELQSLETASGSRLGIAPPHWVASRPARNEKPAATSERMVPDFERPCEVRCDYGTAGTRTHDRATSRSGCRLSGDVPRVRQYPSANALAACPGEPNDIGLQRAVDLAKRRTRSSRTIGRTPRSD